MTCSAKELFYCAYILRFTPLIGVEYLFPPDENLRNRELNEVKRDLHKRKLLRENSKGEITLTSELSTIMTTICKPDNAFNVKNDIMLFQKDDTILLLEKNSDDYTALIFADLQSAKEYTMEILKKGVSQ